MQRTSWIALAALLSLAAPAGATQILFSFSATVTSTDGTLAALGDTLSGQFAYNDDLAACGQTGAEPVLITFCNAGPGYTLGPDWRVSVALGTQSGALTSSQADMQLDITLGRFVNSADPSQGHGEDAFQFRVFAGVFTIQLVDLGGSALDDPDGTFPNIPTSLDLAEWIDRSTLQVAGLGLGSFTAQLNTLTVSAPEPSVAELLGLGLLALGAVRSRSRSQIRSHTAKP